MQIYAFIGCIYAILDKGFTMMNWDDIRIFLALAAAGTHKAAARTLKVDQATVGRRIKEFESELGTKLFDKRSDGFVLTAAGAQLLDRAQGVESMIADIERSATALDKSPKGVIRLAMPGGMANHWLVPRLKPFFENYPEIQLEMLTGPEVVNLWKRDADIAIRLVEPQQKELFFRKMGEIELGFYLAKRRRFNHDTPFVGLFDRSTSQGERKLLVNAGLSGVPAIYRTHAWSSVFYAIRAGLGYGVLPSFYDREGKEISKIPGMPTSKIPLWLVMHPDVRGSGRIKALTDFLLQGW
jgi:DNA-binding transcriptional LysR family regulator